MSRLNRSISYKGFAPENESSDDKHLQCGALGFGIDADDALSNYGDDSQPYSDLTGPQYSAPQRFFLPLHYEAKYQYPLIVWLHNDGFNENQIEQLMPHISLRNFVAVGVRGIRAADSVGHRFDWHNSASAIESTHHRISAAIDDATSQFSVHPDRIILAGYQSGGTMAMRIAMRDPDRFAAVASFGGRMPQGSGVLGDLERLRRRKLPMLWQWAEDDVNYQAESLKEDIQLAMTIKAKVDIIQHKGDDEMTTATLGELNQWIMSRIVSGVAASSAASARWSTSPTQFSCN